MRERHGFGARSTLRLLEALNAWPTRYRRFGRAFDVSQHARNRAIENERVDLDTDGWGYRLDHRECSDSAYEVSKNCDALDLRRDLFKQLRPFRSQTVLKLHEASGVPAWPRQGRRVT